MAWCFVLFAVSVFTCLHTSTYTFLQKYRWVHSVLSVLHLLSSCNNTSYQLLGFNSLFDWLHPILKYGDGLVTKSCLILVTPWTVACQVPLSLGFSRQEYWSGLAFPSLGDLPDPGIEPRSPALWTDSFTDWAMREALLWICHILFIAPQPMDICFQFSLSFLMNSCT